MRTLLVGWFVACFVGGCAAPLPPEISAPTGPLKVVASFYPLADFARRIGGDRVQVSQPSGAADPAGWAPSLQDIASIQAADLVLINGANFEQWPSQVALPFNGTVDTTAAHAKALLTYADAVKHQHGKAGEHDHVGIDGHTWLDPVLAKAQARAIHAALVRARPAHKAHFDTGMAQLAADLDALDVAFGALPKVPLIASHPAYNYLARRYGWSILSFDLDPDAAPSPEQVALINTKNAQHGATLMLWESNPSAAAAAFPLKSVVFSPVEQAPESGDYISAMRANLARLAR